MKLRILKLHPNAQVPAYAHADDACFDLAAATVAGFSHVGTGIDHGQPVMCCTGLAFEVPQGHVMLIFSRSGHGINQGLRLANCVGVIDPGYTGEVMVKLTQDMLYDAELDARWSFVKPGDRIAQALILPVPRVEFEVAEQLTITERGANGFGSTGQGAA
ncbi:dUTP diphosphatase [Macromonas nakdongensis]|uniref:dUTP diphosphatase n=1 Tax=Macromonas nakdongensis TaxID=1843082 RepID=UPI000C3407E4|nr:dUTP diphosphatase [Macromonas nakdongensis]